MGARLAAARKAAGLTQAQLAEKSGLDPQTVHRIEAAKIAVSMLRLRDLAQALGINLSDVVGEPDGVRDSVEEVAALWSRVPEDRRELALRLLRDLVRP